MLQTLLANLITNQYKSSRNEFFYTKPSTILLASSHGVFSWGFPKVATTSHLNVRRQYHRSNAQSRQCHCSLYTNNEQQNIKKSMLATASRKIKLQISKVLMQKVISHFFFAINKNNKLHQLVSSLLSSFVNQFLLSY